MSALKVKDISKALTAKGFVAEKSHHTMYWYVHAGKKTAVRTRLSHGETEYGSNLLGQMAKQMGLSKDQLHEFVECTLSGAAYSAHLVATKKVITDVAADEKKESQPALALTAERKA